MSVVTATRVVVAAGMFQAQGKGIDPPPQAATLDAWIPGSPDGAHMCNPLLCLMTLVGPRTSPPPARCRQLPGILYL
jgi:hypothetical protein